MVRLSPHQNLSHLYLSVVVFFHKIYIFQCAKVIIIVIIIIIIIFLSCQKVKTLDVVKSLNRKDLRIVVYVETTRMDHVIFL